MKLTLTAILVLAASVPAYAAVGAPEIDGALVIQFAALAGGLALLFKKKR